MNRKNSKRSISIILFISVVVTCVYFSTIHAEENEQFDLEKPIEKINDSFPLTGYNPLFILFGDPITKVQFSLKYQFVEKVGFYFGYTQVMFWKLWENSEPFRDVNYNPEIFYHLSFNCLILDSIDFGFYEHKSNGRDGEDSRSYDSSYLRINLIQIFKNDFIMGLRVKLFALYNLDEYNSDIRDYMSFYFIEFGLGYRIGFLKIGMYTKFIPGGVYSGDLKKSSQELGFLIGPRISGIKIPYFFVQYRHGYMDSLLDYKKKESTIRAGISLYR